MAWRIHLQNPRHADSGITSFGSTGTTETRKMGSGPNAITLFKQGGEDWWHECMAFFPELPAELTGKVTKVTFHGAPPTQNIIPGLYEEGENSASVEPNGEKLKVELTAKDVESARALWRKILKNDDSIRTVAYVAA